MSGLRRAFDRTGRGTDHAFERACERGFGPIAEPARERGDGGAVVLERVGARVHPPGRAVLHRGLVGDFGEAGGEGRTRRASSFASEPTVQARAEIRRRSRPSVTGGVITGDTQEKTTTTLVLGGTGRTGRRVTEGTPHLADGVRRALGWQPRDFADYARHAAGSGVWNDDAIHRR
jgi:hypothetical protein